MKKDYDSTRIYRNTQKKGASQTYDTPSFIVYDMNGIITFRTVVISGHGHFWSKSLKVLLSNGYKKGGKPHLKVWPPTTYL